MARDRSERGVAMVVTLLLLSLMTALSVVMYLSVNSDLLINGYYANFRAAYYAADSGLNIARAYLLSQVQAQVPGTWAAPPIANPTLVANTATTNLSQAYGSSTSLNVGKGATSWQESFTITNATFSLAPGSPTVTSRDQNNNPTGYEYIYTYLLTSVGSSGGSQQSTVSEKGSLTYNITGAAKTVLVNFSAYGGFVDQFPPCLAPLTPGTMTGPMFTNGAWQFTTGGQYIFTDPIGQANANADYWFGNNCIQSPTTSYTSGRQTIRPTFQGGYNLGQPAVPLPTNDFSQQRAVLDGQGTNVTALTNAQMNAALVQVSAGGNQGMAYPLAGASSGVFAAYTAGTPNVMTGGGLYVQGDATIQVSTSGTSAQIFTITNSGTTSTVTVDPMATPPMSWNCPAGTTGTTTITSGSVTTNICSVPMNNISHTAATMLYVNGAITSLSGPGPGQPGIQDYNQITICAKNDITATGDVLYKTEPVTTTQNQVVPGTNPPCCNNSPVDTLIPGADKNQVLGIFTLAGNFNTKVSVSGSNIEVDGSIATISQGGTGGFLNTGQPVNVFNNVGGQVQNSIYGEAITTQNVYFDRRYTDKPGFAPPFFPSTTVTQGGALATNVVSTVQRIQWVNQTALQ